MRLSVIIWKALSKRNVKGDMPLLSLQRTSVCLFASLPKKEQREIVLKGISTGEVIHNATISKSVLNDKYLNGLLPVSVIKGRTAFSLTRQNRIEFVE